MEGPQGTSCRSFQVAIGRYTSSWQTPMQCQLSPPSCLTLRLHTHRPSSCLQDLGRRSSGPQGCLLFRMPTSGTPELVPPVVLSCVCVALGCGPSQGQEWASPGRSLWPLALGGPSLSLQPAEWVGTGVLGFASQRALLDGRKNSRCGLG